MHVCSWLKVDAGSTVLLEPEALVGTPAASIYAFFTQGLCCSEDGTTSMTINLKLVL